MKFNKVGRAQRAVRERERVSQFSVPSCKRVSLVSKLSPRETGGKDFQQIRIRERLNDGGKRRKWRRYTRVSSIRHLICQKERGERNFRGFHRYRTGGGYRNGAAKRFRAWKSEQREFVRADSVRAGRKGFAKVLVTFVRNELSRVRISSNRARWAPRVAESSRPRATKANPSLLSFADRLNPRDDAATAISRANVATARHRYAEASRRPK